jgi:cell division control protein 6
VSAQLSYIELVESESPFKVAPAQWRAAMPENAMELLTDSLQSKIFADERVFCPDYLPEILHGREPQIRDLLNHFRGVIKHPQEISQNAILQGPVASGKTVLVQFFYDLLDRFESKTNSFSKTNSVAFRCVHINCRQTSQPIPLLTSIIHEADPYFPTRGFSPDELLQALVKCYAAKKTHLILCLDDFEYLLNTKDGTDLLHNFVRFHDDLSNRRMRLSLILVTRSAAFHTKGENAIFSALRGKIIQIPSYTTEELTKILHNRAQKGFRPNLIDATVVETIAGMAAPQDDDARLAIRLLWNTGQRADRLKASKIEDSHIPRNEPWQQQDAETVFTASSEPELPIHEEFLLQALKKGLKNDQTRKLTMGQLKTHYNAVCTNAGEPPRHHTQLWKLIGNLKHKKLLVSEVGPHPEKRGRTSLISLL